MPACPQIRSEAQQSGTLYPPNHPYVRRVKQIGQQIVRTALENKGGGYTKHLEVHPLHGLPTHYHA